MRALLIAVLASPLVIPANAVAEALLAPPFKPEAP